MTDCHENLNLSWKANSAFTKLILLTYSQGNMTMYYKMQVTAPQNVGLENQGFDVQGKTSNK